MSSKKVLNWENWIFFKFKLLGHLYTGVQESLYLRQYPLLLVANSATAAQFHLLNLNCITLLRIVLRACKFICKAALTIHEACSQFSLFCKYLCSKQKLPKGFYFQLLLIPLVYTYKINSPHSHSFPPSSQQIMNSPSYCKIYTTKVGILIIRNYKNMENRRVVCRREAAHLLADI